VSPLASSLRTVLWPLNHDAVQGGEPDTRSVEHGIYLDDEAIAMMGGRLVRGQPGNLAPR
jgi:hypothetical protein